ncbi:MAG: 8-oxo-dGTP diphosphatase [Clostridia bacterium]|nr:8-oxo-dGTP diphosphatase [Clostridia bacterium]
MRNSTVCYIIKDGKYLMLHRVKEENDMNRGKWITVGGGCEEKESPEDCVVREVKEESGLTLLSYRFRGIVTFVSDKYETEYMYIFTSDDFEGELIDCDEGVLEWVDEKDVGSLPQWEGDRLFFGKILNDEPFFSMKLVYEGDRLVEAFDEGKRIDIG